MEQNIQFTQTKLDAFCNSRNVRVELEFLVAGTITIAFGAPLAVGAAAVAAFEIGNVSLKIVGKRRGLAEFRRFDPVTYLVSARELPEA